MTNICAGPRPRPAVRWAALEDMLAKQKSEVANVQGDDEELFEATLARQRKDCERAILMGREIEERLQCLLPSNDWGWDFAVQRWQRSSLASLQTDPSTCFTAEIAEACIMALNEGQRPECQCRTPGRCGLPATFGGGLIRWGTMAATTS